MTTGRGLWAGRLGASGGLFFVRELAQGAGGWGRLRADNQEAIAMRFETARNPELVG